MEQTTVSSAGLQVLRRGPGLGRDNPLVLGAARFGSTHSQGDIRTPGERPGSDEYLFPGEKPSSEGYIYTFVYPE